MEHRYTLIVKTIRLNRTERGWKRAAPTIVGETGAAPGTSADISSGVPPK